MEEVLKIGIPKGIDMKIRKTFDRSNLPLVINIVEIPVQVHSKYILVRVLITTLFFVTVGSNKYPSFWE